MEGGEGKGEVRREEREEDNHATSVAFMLTFPI